MKKGLIVLILVALVGGWFGAQFFLNKKADEAIESFRKDLGPDSKFEYENRKINPLSMNVIMEKASIVTPDGQASAEYVEIFPLSNTGKAKNIVVDSPEHPFIIDEIEINEYKLENEIPTDMKMTLKKLSVAVDDKEYTEATGSETADVDMQLELHTNSKEQTVRYDINYFNVNKLFNSSSKISLSNIDIQELAKIAKIENRQEREKAFAGYSNKLMSASIQKISFSFENAGFLEAALKTEMKGGKTEAETRDMWAKELTSAVEDPQIAPLKPIVDGMIKLAKKEANYIQISFDPKEPVGATEIFSSFMMGNTQEIVNKLNLTVTTK